MALQRRAGGLTRSSASAFGRLALARVPRSRRLDSGFMPRFLPAPTRVENLPGVVPAGDRCERQPGGRTAGEPPSSGSTRSIRPEWGCRRHL